MATETVTQATVAVIAPGGAGPEGELLHADRHLPPEPTPLIGRADLLDDACALLRDADVRLVTLTGAAGAGKTRLAVATAGAVAPDFRDGARFVDLSSVGHPERVAGTIATALGVRDAGEQPLMARLQRALRDRRLLLVLDNFEQVLTAAPDVGELLAACPGVKALVTSRAALHLRWEHELAVPPLQVPDLGSLPALAELAGVPAVALFLHRARAVRHDFALDEAGARAVAEVCVRLDGLPLAIELAAARTRVLPPAALLSRLERRLQLLVGGAPDRPTRHQTLRGALDWSHELLEAPERALLRRLAVFAGGFTLEGATAVAGDIGSRDVLDALETLVDYSLVRPAPVLRGEARYSLLETVREYAAERLANSGDGPAVRRRHAAHYLTLAETAAGALRGVTQTAWLARLEEEHGNFRAVLSRSLVPGDAAGEGVADAAQLGAGGLERHLADRDEQDGWDEQDDRGDLGLRLAGALAPFWRVHGHLSEGLGWLERFLAPGADVDDAVRARALLGAGALGRERARWDGARAWLEAGLTLSRQVQDARLIGQTACALGQVLMDSGAVAEARPLLEEGVQRLRFAGGPGDLGDALLALATLAEAGGDLRRSSVLLEEALATGRREGDGTVVVAALYDLGRLCLFHADGVRARALFEEGLQVAEALGSPGLSMHLHRWLGTAASQAGDAALASRHLRASLHLAREHDDQLGIAYTLAALGECALRVRDPEAVPLLEDSLRHFTALRHPWGRGRALKGLAAAANVARDPARALTLLGEALVVWRDLDDALAIAGCLERVAEALTAEGHTLAAARLYGAAAAQRERLGVAGSEVDPPAPVARSASPDAPSWRQAWAAGRALAPDAAIAMALALTTASSASGPTPGGPTLSATASLIPTTHLPFDLTPREAEVIRLLAQGASDAEIARQLIVSVRTVNRHVANILGKTEAPNRTAAAALAHRSGLAGAAV